MTGRPNRRAIDWCERPDTSALDTAWVATIERIRAEQAPTICRACGSTTPEHVEKRWCSKCSDWLPLAWFSKDRSPSRHVRRLCKLHEREQSKAYRSRQALEATGVTS